MVGSGTAVFSQAAKSLKFFAKQKENKNKINRMRIKTIQTIVFASLFLLMQVFQANETPVGNLETSAESDCAPA